jgi:DNA-binding transcriptional MerR regulator
MTRPEDIPDKPYFRIGEAARLVGVEAHVLRFWESEFRQIRPERTAGARRVYTRRHIELFLRIKKLLYDDQYTIAGAKKRLAEPAASPSTPPHDPEAAALLKDVRGELVAIKALLDGE